MILTCDQHTAEAQEGELTDWLRIKLHAGDELNIDSEPLSHTRCFILLLLPPHTQSRAFPNQEIPQGTFPLETSGRRTQDACRNQGHHSSVLSEKDLTPWRTQRLISVLLFLLCALMDKKRHQCCRPVVFFRNCATEMTVSYHYYDANCS